MPSSIDNDNTLSLLAPDHTSVYNINSVTWRINAEQWKATQKVTMR